MQNSLGGFGIGSLAALRKGVVSRSISAENFNGNKGGGAMATEGFGRDYAKNLGRGWKISPAVEIGANECFTIADIEGAGVIRHIWITAAKSYRFLILRMYWDDSEVPSVECPLGDFFANGYGFETTKALQLNSLAVCVNSRNGMNCYWLMPFRKRCRITLENISVEPAVCFYQVDYTLESIPDDCGYFHAQFRRTNPLPYKKDYTILNRIEGCGHYVGTNILWSSKSNEWWGEGEIKFFIDGDEEFPTICGTGTEDYFCGAWCFNQKDEIGKDIYREFSGPYTGFIQAEKIDDYHRTQKRFQMYRWHITDPVHFAEDLKITIQALGMIISEGETKYLPLQDDISSVAYWYQSSPARKREALPDKEFLKIT